MNNRKIVSICSNYTPYVSGKFSLFALCDDGTVWIYAIEKKHLGKAQRYTE